MAHDVNRQKTQLLHWETTEDIFWPGTALKFPSSSIEMYPFLTV